MDAKVGVAAAQKDGYEPTSDLIQEQDCDTLLIYLPGFKKEQLRVQLARSGTLRISGARPIGDNKSSSFQTDYPISPNCDTANISAKFEGGILYIRQPKLIVPAEKEDEKSPVLEPQPAAQRPVEQRLPTPIPSRPNKDQENDHTKKTSSSDRTHTKQETAADVPDHKSAPKEDTKPVGEVGEPADDYKKEKTGTVPDYQTSITDPREDISAYTDSESANKRTGKVGKDGVNLDYYKLVAAGTTAKLMKSGKITYTVMVIILAFAFGMYVSNLIWCSNKPEN